MTMITFTTENRRFTYRVVGIALHDGHVLLQSDERADFWFPPGGRAELLEAAHETLTREMHEELAVQVHVERLLWVVENFFVYKGRAGHELALYFLMHLPPDSPRLAKETPFICYEEGVRLTFQWFALDALATLPLYPTFLRTRLHTLPQAIEHLVHTDAASAAELAAIRAAAATP